MTSGKRSHLPVPVRDAVMARAGYRCCFVGIDGVRCTQTRNLHVDHIVPVALGGCDDPDNLRVLCAAHNLYEAQRLLGSELMDRYGKRRADRIRESGQIYLRESGRTYHRETHPVIRGGSTRDVVVGRPTRREIGSGHAADRDGALGRQRTLSGRSR